MKKLLLILTVCLFITPAWADNFAASQTLKRGVTPRGVPIQQKRNEGAVQRGVRNGSPLQMINPFAPIEYGDGSEFVYYDENDPFQHTTPGKPVAKGLKLFGFSF